MEVWKEQLREGGGGGTGRRAGRGKLGGVGAGGGSTTPRKSGTTRGVLRHLAIKSPGEPALSLFLSLLLSPEHAPPCGRR